MLRNTCDLLAVLGTTAVGRCYDFDGEEATMVPRG